MVEAKTARRIEESVFVQRDRRADGGARRIRVTRDDVLDRPPIQRRLHGHLGARHRLLRGRARRAVRATTDRRATFLSLAHSDPDLDILLGETQDCGAVAVRLALTGRPGSGCRGVTEEDGALRSLERAAEAIVAASARRRCDANVRKRRPRFLIRRKAGDSTPHQGSCMREEREIISYE